MKKTDIDTLMVGLRAAISFEVTNWVTPALSEYVELINDITKPSQKISVCGTCSALTKRLHSDFQIHIWKTLVEHYPTYVPPIPIMETPKYATDFWQNTIKVNSFEYLRNCREQLRADMGKANKQGLVELVAKYKNDDFSFDIYIKEKLAYFDTDCFYDVKKAQIKSKQRADINWLEVEIMLNEGVKQVDIAKHFGVEKYVITRLVQKNKK